MMQAQIFFDRDDRKKDQPLHKFFMDFLIKSGIAGATLFEGTAGFGKNDHIQHPNQLFSFDEVPTIITFIDEDEKVINVIKEIRKLGTNGTIVTHHVDVY